jgi:branched-chain amino acid transport system substrate-binding protein
VSSRRAPLAALSFLALTVILGSGACSLVVDTKADQCASDGDCAAKGAAFAGSVCVAGACTELACTSGQVCRDHFQAPAICRTDGRCAKLQSEDCQELLADPADLTDDSVQWFGVLLPRTGAGKSRGTTDAHGMELARRDFKTSANGLPPGATGTSRRNLGLVVCDDAVDPIRAATHLVDDLKLPAILGPAFSGVTIKVATGVTIDKGVLLLSPSATSPYITKLADNGLVWRTAPSDTEQALAMSLVLSTRLEPQVRTSVLKAGESLRLAIAHKGDAYGKGLSGALYDVVKFNAKSAADNGASFKEIDFGDPGDPTNTDPPAKYAAATSALLAFQPHVIILVGTGEGVLSVFSPTEQQWTAAFRPRWLMSDGEQLTELWQRLGSDADLRSRVLGTSPGSTSPLYDKFQSRYRATFTDGTSPDQYAASSFDATYLLAYAAAQIGKAPLTGAALAKGLTHMVPPGTAIDVGPEKINDAFDALAVSATANIDFNGASGPLDFDVSTGEADADIVVWCADVDASGTAIGFKRSGMHYSAATKTLTGTPSCP